MARYSAFNYKTDYYGEIPRLPFSVEPFFATALDYTKVSISWVQPKGTGFTGLRLVRNQDGYSESAEDGVILFERPSTALGNSVFLDGEDNFNDEDTLNDVALVSGRFVYYTMWIRKDDTTWAVAGQTYTLLPKEHGSKTPDGTILLKTQDRFMDFFPRVYTSDSQSPLGVVDPSSILYNFMRGFSFTVDELLTYADILLPDFSVKTVGPGLLKLKAAEYGLIPEDVNLLRRQKRMVREALYLYARKGTEAALGTMIESLTGFAPTIVRCPNLFLSLQDSTFYKGSGFWQAVGDVDMSVTNTVIPPTAEEEAVDTAYTLRCEHSTPGAYIFNGLTNPRTRGIPVTNGEEYTFSFYAKSDDAVSVTPVVHWYSAKGEEISVSSGDTAYLTSSWAQLSETVTAPGTPYSITEYSVTNGVVTMTTSEAHSFEIGDTVFVSGVGVLYAGARTVTAKTSTTFSFAVNFADVNETTVAGVLDVSGTTYDIISFNVTSNVVTVTTSTAHGLSVSDAINIAGLGNEYDGDEEVYEVVDSVTFKYLPSVPATSASGTASTEPAAYAGVSIELGDVGVSYFDLMQFATSDTDYYHEARGVEIFVAPSKTNYVLDPSFENAALIDWYPSTTSVNLVDTTLPDVFVGESMLSIDVTEGEEFSLYTETNAGANSGLNKFYVFSIYAQSDVAQSLDVTLEFIDSSTSVTHTHTAEAVSEDWSRIDVTLFVPDTMDSATGYFRATISGTMAEGTVNFDAAQLQEGYYPSDYFDGSFPAQYGITWEATAHQSESHMYLNKNSKMVRLVQELERYLPSGTAYLLNTYSGKEFDGITM